MTLSCFPKCFFIGTALAWSFSCLERTHGAMLAGELPQGPSLQEYVGKFCFDFSPAHAPVGLIELNTFSGVIPESEPSDLYLMMFDDDQHWKTARRTWRSSSCDEKKKLASYVHGFGFTTDGPYWNFTTDGPYWKRKRTDGPYWNFTTDLHEGIRPRWWHYTVVSCGKGLTSPLRYSIHSQNSLRGWQSEFSMDHQGMLPLHVICSVLFLVAILTNVCWIRCRPVPLQQGLAEHPYFKIMMLAYAASTVSCLAKAAHYGKFMLDGYGSNRLRLLGVVSAIVANSTIFIIAMMVSKGWAIGNVSFSNRSIFLSLIAIMGSLSALCELYAEANLDESTTVYSYQSPGGVAACVLKIFFFCWFSHEIKGTHDEEMDRKPKQFYKVFGLAFSIWFACPDHRPPRIHAQPMGPVQDSDSGRAGRTSQRPGIDIVPVARTRLAARCSASGHCSKAIPSGRL